MMARYSRGRVASKQPHGLDAAPVFRVQPPYPGLVRPPGPHCRACLRPKVTRRQLSLRACMPLHSAGVHTDLARLARDRWSAARAWLWPRAPGALAPRRLDELLQECSGLGEWDHLASSDKAGRDRALRPKQLQVGQGDPSGDDAGLNGCLM